jgi:hypothetical protein
MVITGKGLGRFVMTLLALQPLTVLEAAVTARVDRADIELNESFTLEITTDADIDVQPDMSVLEDDFFVGQGSQLSNTTIANGQIRRSKTWSYVLMPKRAGDLEIPPIAVGSESSNALRVFVEEPTYAPPGEADVFVTSEVDFAESYVQAQVLLTVKVYRSVATRQPALRDPTVSGVDGLIELAGDDRSYEAIINGTAYSVFERVFAIYPQESGRIELSPARFEARVLRGGRITGRKVFQSEPLSVEVLPAPPPPPEHPNAAWLPAHDLQLSEDWSADSDSIEAGEPLTRHVTVSALGQLETQIPAIAPPEADGINVYPDKPDLSRLIEPGGIRGIRKDQYALIGVRGGEVVLPALELPWWNVNTREWQVERLPERRITILPSAAALPEKPEPVTEPSGETEAQPTVVREGGSIWRRVAELLGALWLLTLFGWWWTSRPGKAPREPAPVPPHRRQARFLKTARRAALDGDTAMVKSALLDWARMQWPDDAPRSVGAMAARVSSPLCEELRVLSKQSYGPAGGDWDGTALAKALRSFAVVEERGEGRAEELPPLMPAG